MKILTVHNLFKGFQWLSQKIWARRVYCTFIVNRRTNQIYAGLPTKDETLTPTWNSLNTTSCYDLCIWLTRGKLIERNKFMENHYYINIQYSCLWILILWEYPCIMKQLSIFYILYINLAVCLFVCDTFKNPSWNNLKCLT